MLPAGPASLPPIFTHAAARHRGISDRDLYRWRDEGIIDQLARGIFSQPGIQADPDLVEIAVRAPQATLCLTTALARHGLVDDIPDSIDVALPRPERPPRMTAPVTWHRFDPATFAIGRQTLAVHDDLTTGIYGPERSIIDALRLRHLYGEEQAVEALRRWLARPGHQQPADLLGLARSFPVVETELRNLLRVLL